MRKCIQKTMRTRADLTWSNDLLADMHCGLHIHLTYFASLRIAGFSKFTLTGEVVKNPHWVLSTVH